MWCLLCTGYVSIAVVVTKGGGLVYIRQVFVGERLYYCIYTCNGTHLHFP